MATKAKTDGGLVETVKTIVYALLIAGVFRTLFFQPFWIPSGSMKDTLLIGDFLFVNKMAYGYSRFSCPFGLCPINGRILGRDPERGDVVVFRHPVNGSDFIKRLIGLPGDRVQMKNGVLFLNGTEVPQTPDGTFTEIFAPQGPMGQYPRCENGPVGEGGLCNASRFTETLPPTAANPEGRRHSILNIDTNGFADNTDVFTVPAGHSSLSLLRSALRNASKASRYMLSRSEIPPFRLSDSSRKPLARLSLLTLASAIPQ